MKRFIAGATIAFFAGPAVAAGVPYEQSAIDRALPRIEQTAASSADSRNAAHSAATLPYEQNAVDRRLPDIEQHAASSGDTRSATVEGRRDAAWTKDYRFIAPAM